MTPIPHPEAGSGTLREGVRPKLAADPLLLT